MGGGLIQLVAYGTQDLYLTHDPQITFFRMVYKRHTNFSCELIPQYFNSVPNFNEKVTCTISKSGDLIGKIYLYIKLPSVPKFFDFETGDIDDTKKFAWVKKVGYSIVKSIELDIGGHIIDKHYGDWLNIWNELSLRKNKRSIDEMIGDIPQLTNFTNGKDSYELMIPLEFWFCRNEGIALPIIALQYSDVKVHIEFDKLENICIFGPTNSIEIDEHIVHFKKYEYIEQTILNKKNYGIFINHDVINKRIEYIKINDNFLSKTSDTYVSNNTDYLIKGVNSKFSATPKLNSVESNININILDLSISKSFLYINYIYLDNDERLKFAKANHEYLIDCLQFDGDRNINNQSTKLNIGYSHPCKEIIWCSQLKYISKKPFNNSFNYTNNVDKKKGESIIKKSRLLLNGIERTPRRNYSFYNYLQPFQCHSNSPSEGISMYSFSLFPEIYQPSGTCNFSKIDDIVLEVTVDKEINYSNPGIIKVFAVTKNVLRILNGLAGLAFSN